MRFLRWFRQPTQHAPQEVPHQPGECPYCATDLDYPCEPTCPAAPKPLP